MKLGEKLRGENAWERLGEMVMEALTAGEKAKDGGIYMIGLRLVKIITDLGNIELNQQPTQQPPKPGIDKFQDLFKKGP